MYWIFDCVTDVWKNTAYIQLRKNQRQIPDAYISEAEDAP